MEICQRLGIFSIHDVSTAVCTLCFRCFFVVTLFNAASESNSLLRMLIARNSPHKGRRRQQTKLIKYTSLCKFYNFLSQVTYKFHISLFPLYLELLWVWLLASGLSRPLNPRKRKCNGKWGSAERTLNCTPPFPLSHTQLTKWLNRDAQRGWGL